MRVLFFHTAIDNLSPEHRVHKTLAESARPARGPAADGPLS
jgi:hypothetical protein